MSLTASERDLRRDRIADLIVGQHPETVTRLIQILRAEGYDTAGIGPSDPPEPSEPPSQCTTHPPPVPPSQCTTHPPPVPPSHCTTHPPARCIWICAKAHCAQS
jgi:hypothetical protein